MGKNKSGQMNTMMLIFFIFLCFIAIFFTGVLIYLGTTIDSIMSGINIRVGEVNFNETYNQTLAPAIHELTSNIDYAGIGLLFGMIMIMLVCGYKFRESKRLFIIVDLFIIIISYIISVIIQNYYNQLININSDLYTIYTTNLHNSSVFLLRLPIIIPIVGALILIVSYATINKKREVQVYDYDE